MRIIFLGTPEFAVPTLEKLIAWPRGRVVGLIANQDRPAGRGNKLKSPPTKVVAQAHNIPVLQPARLSSSPETFQAMQELEPDILVMVAFGQILKPNVLTMATKGVVNLHGSLLPRLRGAAPINWAIINGDEVTGVTTMYSDSGVDTGPMLLKYEVPILEDMNASELSQVLSVVGADLTIETLERILDGTIEPQAQDHSQATQAPMLTRHLGLLDWSQPALRIHNLIRGLVPWPGTRSGFRGEMLGILRSCAAKESSSASHTPGEVVAITPALRVACGQGGRELIDLLQVKPANRGSMSARDWANGVRLKAGDLLQSLKVDDPEPKGSHTAL